MDVLTLPATIRRSVPFATDAAKWEAVRCRDAAADGHFFFAVKTTGVYCRPSCPARAARRENVTFHRTRADAERAGYRACKRCRPDLPARAERDATLVTAACRTIEAAEEMPALSDLAAQAHVSPYHFHRLFKRITGVTPRAYWAAERQRRVQDNLAAGAPVTDAMYAAGFNSGGRFYAAAPGALGMTPSAYKDGGRAETIRYGLGRCSLGSVLVAAADRGICAILLGDEPSALVADLAARFRRAQLIAEPSLGMQIAAVVRLIDHPGAAAASLPLDIRGTAFQRRVWEALRDIPAGNTASYGEIARRIGKPHAVRAVANACAANPLAVAIPCHRAVGSDGALTGYRWGIERKRTLLENESKKRR
jgi:AraC family transcriptional regulator of adaptative response/methylated-DNA-[protein]-cysteine methyltransferase